MNPPRSADAIIVGDIFFETIIHHDGRVLLNSPGGSALYCAAGFRIWGKHPGILSKIIENRPTSWMQTYQSEGCDTTGIKRIRGAFDQERFYAINEEGKIAVDSPQKYFFAINQPLPKFLLGYEPPQASKEVTHSLQPSSITPDDIPQEFFQISQLVIAPTDLYTQMIVPPFYRSKTDGHLIFCGADTFMQPSYWYEFPPLIRGAQAFVASEDQLKRLFLGKNENMWEMVEFVAATGVEVVLIFSDSGDHFLYDQPAQKKYRIPRYPISPINPIGVYPAFCGGFSSGYITHFDPLESALMASVTASIKMEGAGPLFLLQTMPELAQARVNALRERIITA